MPIFKTQFLHFLPLPFGFQEMSRGNGLNPHEPLGIRHRFLNFVINSLIGPKRKRVSLGGDGSTPPSESMEVPITGGVSSRNYKNGGEVVIDFRHIDNEEAEISTNSIQKLSSSVVDFSNKKSGFISMADQNLQKRGGKERRNFDSRRGNLGEKGKKERTEEENGNHSIMRPSSSSRPLLTTVASNINQKAEDFIRSRKETMNNHYRFGQITQETSNS
ncbi:hypothetical protein M9H77_01566 [Catharanthus roseus]|uniref:Uncharacterized protein n=1 Tax=Catharanthus roseus TaxID=4058 RepID=A0ACC0C6A2_CATRO|nr:hypothetical protein M9H77_01566 [Catharanthus roseus]